MTTSKYFIKVSTIDIPKFEGYLKENKIEFTLMSTDWGTTASGMTHLYSVVMDTENAMILKLTFPLAGCMNFVATLNKLQAR